MTSLATEAPTSQSVPPAIVAQSSAANGSKDQSGGMSFGDILDVINPLQHIPVISTVYRELTGDKISAAAQVAGDSLYGGILGLASSMVNEVIEGATGNDIGGHIWATLFGDDSDAKPVQTADAAPAAQATLPPPPAATAKSAGAPVVSSATAAVTPLNGPTSFYQDLQRGRAGTHGVPLNTTVPIGDPHQSGAQALLQAQQQQNGPQAQATASALGTTGLSASTSTPPPAIAAAPPPPNAAAAAPVQGNIADKMMQGLDKYKAFAIQQDNGSGASPTPSLGTPTALID